MGSGAEARAKDFDFSKTKQFIREMETRPDFPVSMMLARDYAYSLSAMGEKIDNARKQSIITFIKSLQQHDGGFTGDKTSKDASLLFTDQALEILSYLNAQGAVDLHRVTAYVASLKNADGGFGFSQKSKESTLASTYYAVHILNSFNDLGMVDRTKTASYVKGFAKREGGFGYVKGQGTATQQNTYFAAYTLKALRMLDDETKKNTLGFLNTTSYVTGKYNLKDGGSQLVAEQNSAIMTLKLLNAQGRINKGKILSTLKRFYIPQNGGFGPLLGYGSTPDSTCNAIRLLVEIGNLKEPAHYPLRKANS